MAARGPQACRPTVRDPFSSRTQQEAPFLPVPKRSIEPRSPPISHQNPISLHRDGLQQSGCFPGHFKLEQSGWVSCWLTDKGWGSWDGEGQWGWVFA